MLERKDNNASQEEVFHHQSHSPQSEVIQKANMFAAVWINKFAHAQRHRESITESLKNFANDSKESVYWEPVLNKNRFSIPIPTVGPRRRNVLYWSHSLVCPSFLCYDLHLEDDVFRDVFIHMWLFVNWVSHNHNLLNCKLRPRSELSQLEFGFTSMWPIIK